ncbi:MAG: acyl-CoA dehydratase activase-related protein, partial [Candidatus Latescibacteria bacterium]|nr:acyl-CoA dehydratase activase-related protein [Candidatus Latescibacterota bacterium]
AELGIRYINPLLNPGEPKKLEREMFETWQEILGLSVEENARAVCEGFAALDTFVDVVQRDRARSVLDDLEDQDRLGMVLLARPYHNDPGINHEIMTEFQKLGYPIFSQASLPLDKDILQRLFGDEVAEGDISDPLDIGDVWKNSYSENTSQKIFAAKYVARHPNLVALEMSNFKCGHDAPVYTVVEEIIEASGTPLFSFKDIDENKPTGSIKIRVETISYFLAAYRETLVRHREQKQQIDTKMRELEVSLKKKMSDASIGDRLIGA